MRRDAQAVVLLLLGGGLLRLAFTGDYLNYVKPSAFWLIVPTGFALIAVAAVTVREVWRDRPETGHGHREPRVAWLLLAPVVGMLLVAPNALGSYDAERSGTALGSEENRSAYPELPDDADPVPLALLDYAARAVFDEGRTLEGHRIRLRGFIVYDGEEPQLARMVVSCCAADARPVKIGLDSAASDSAASDTAGSDSAASGGAIREDLEPDQWVEVVGVYSPRQGRDEINGALIPYIEVESITPIAAPENEYQ